MLDFNGTISDDEPLLEEIYRELFAGIGLELSARALPRRVRRTLGSRDHRGRDRAGRPQRRAGARGQARGRAHCPLPRASPRVVADQPRAPPASCGPQRRASRSRSPRARRARRSRRRSATRVCGRSSARSSRARTSHAASRIPRATCAPSRCSTPRVRPPRRTRRTRVWVVEDSTAGVLAARAAGMRVVALRTPAYDPQRAPGRADRRPPRRVARPTPLPPASGTHEQPDRRGPRPGTRPRAPRSAASQPLPGGLTNTNYKVDVGGRSYVVRVSAKDSSLLAIDREHEHHASVAAAEVGVGAAVVDYLPERSILVLEFIEGQTQSAEDLRRGDRLDWIADGLSPAARRTTLSRRLRHVRDPGALPPPRRRARFPPARALRRVRGDRFARSARRWPLRDEGTVPCNNDLLAENFIDVGDRFRLIDYEYAGNNDAVLRARQHLERVEPHARAARRARDPLLRRAPAPQDRACAAARAHVEVRLDALGLDPGRRLRDRLRLLVVGHGEVRARRRRVRRTASSRCCSRRPGGPTELAQARERHRDDAARRGTRPRSCGRPARPRRSGAPRPRSRRRRAPVARRRASPRSACPAGIACSDERGEAPEREVADLARAAAGRRGAQAARAARCAGRQRSSTRRSTAYTSPSETREPALRPCAARSRSRPRRARRPARPTADRDGRPGAARAAGRAGRCVPCSRAHASRSRGCAGSRRITTSPCAGGRAAAGGAAAASPAAIGSERAAPGPGPCASGSARDAPTPRPAARASASARSVRSQVNPGSRRPKCPYAAVGR